jgi:hypothetical protein
MKVNSNIFFSSFYLLHLFEGLKKSLGNFELEATFTNDLFLSLDWLADRTSDFSLPSNI